MKLNHYEKIGMVSMFLMVIFISLCLVGSVNAETELVQLNEETVLTFSCTLNNEIPSDSATYNITVKYPNGTIFLDNIETNAIGNGAFEYTATFTELGMYKVLMFCWDGIYSFSDEGYYNITPTGYEINTGKSLIILLSLAMMIITGVLLFIFGLYAKGIVKIFSIGLAIILLFYSFGILINVLNIGIGEYVNLTNNFDNLYVLMTVLLSVGGAGLVLFLVYFAFEAFSKTRGFKD